MAKKIKARNKLVKKEKSNKIWIFVAIVIIALAAIFALQFSGSTPNVDGTTSGRIQGSQTTSIESTGDVCKRDSECFLVNCKNTPNDVKCVNATHEELYYKDCDNNWNNVVPAIQNALTCGCAQGICKVK
jgi:flagellar basal body-associated protein FliL